MKAKRVVKAQVQPVVIPLYICGYCGRDTRKGLHYNFPNKTHKIQISGYANMLCEICQKCLEDEIAHIAKRYLNKSG